MHNSVTTKYMSTTLNKSITDLTKKTISNNITQLEFKNLKIYKQEDYVKNDTTKPFYVSGKITCK